MDKVLREPSYGWRDEAGALIVPTSGQLIREFFSRLNIFESKKNWLAFSSWFWALSLAPCLVIFFVNYFSWWLLPVGFLYSMMFMGCHGTIWYHRYSTHGTFKFSNAFWRFITQNLVVKVISEEAYVVSHHVHHAFSDKPGDPYNAQAGWLYCFLADANHQPIALDLDEKSYAKAARLLDNTGVYINTYAQYKKWGSITHPFWSWLHVALNWAFWYGVFYLIGGHQLALCLFGFAHIWAIGVRTFNFEGHGKGKDMRKEGVDFSRNNLSINQYWPGYIAGEWHSNHHLFPNSARNGFTPSQLDLPWLYIRFLSAIGGVSNYRNSKKLFYEQFYEPYLEEKKKKKEEKKMVSV
jgi:sn-1 stearoyl-lipid 9-desaturase